jgi:hypothetical protein
MKLKASRDFRNNFEPRLKVSGDGASGDDHEDHIHKGQNFEIGSADEFSKLSKAEKQVIGNLLSSDCIVFFSNKEASARIDAEVKQESKRLDNIAKADQASANASIVGQMLKLLQTGAPVK